ncbi:hypothetical protein B0H11DRAFT_1912174 [Mycena galericulata]|nr:hypothetical protein B0H11DRAFT_1912174 [Mycena galericulata]
MAASLRTRLQPPRLKEAKATRSGWTPVTSGQYKSAVDMGDRMPSFWSVKDGLNDGLLAALDTDLDRLFARGPAGDTLLQALKGRVLRVHTYWEDKFGSDTVMELRNEKVTTATSELLIRFAIDAYGDIMKLSQSQPARLLHSVAPIIQHKTYEVDNVIRVDGGEDDVESSVNLVSIEDKQPKDTPQAVFDLEMRAKALKVVKVNLKEYKETHENWWVLANKGALYSAAYGTEWQVCAGTTAYVIGHRSGRHMVWGTSFLNRRNAGDEFTGTDDLGKLSSVFQPPNPPATPQERLHLLFLAVVLRAAIGKNQPGVAALFPTLSQVPVDPPSGQPPEDDATYTASGRDVDTSPGSPPADGGSDGSGSDYSPPGGRKRSGGGEGRATELAVGSVAFTGQWEGELAERAGYRIILGDFIAHGGHGVVQEGVIKKGNKEVSAVAVKYSDDTAALRAEFSVYKRLGPRFPHIPRCFGLLVYFGTAYLVTELASRRAPVDLALMGKADRGAIYAALRAMHKKGYTHNDLVAGDRSLHNLVWNAKGKPVLLDLVTAQAHRCGPRCTELGALRDVLRLTKHDTAIWARDAN